jgi:hypothetical protein
MITKSNTTAAILALTGAAVFLPSAADAAIVYADGDLLLGFRASAGQGASTDYLVNLGSAASILNSPGSIQFNLGPIATDLVNLYGANWFNRADVFWSVSGTQKSAGNGYLANTMFVTRADDVDGPLGTNTTVPWDRIGSFGAGAPAGKISQMGTTYRDQLGTGVMESTFAPGALLQPTNVPNSYASYQANVGANGSASYGQFADTNGSEETFALGATSAVLDAYTLVPGSAGSPSTFSGNFTINQTGQVTFTGAVPEPTAMLSLSLGGLVLASLRHRRSPVQTS